VATTLRSLDRWLAISWGLVVVSLLIVRWLDITALSRVLSVRTVVVFTILLAVMSMARDLLFRQLLLFAVLASLMAVAAVVRFHPPFVDGELILEFVVPSTGYLVMALMAARIVAAALGEAIGHPYECECISTNPPA
jgi:hypothetical protein